MASGYCKNCGRWSENLHIMNDCCSDRCAYELKTKTEKAYYANRRAEEEKREQITRDKIKTAASVTSAVMLAKQTALMEEQNRQAQAQARAEAIAAAQAEEQRQAEQLDAYNKAAKKYGFTDFADAYQYIKGTINENETVTEEVIKRAAEKKAEGLERIKEEMEFRANERKRIADGREELYEIMTEEQQSKDKKIRKVVDWFDTDHTIGLLFMHIFSVVLSIILGIVLYNKFKYIFGPFGFFTTLVTFGFIGAVIGFIIEDLNFKLRINKISRIKGKDDFPFYVVSDFRLNLTLQKKLVEINGVIAAFFWLIKLHMPIANTLYHVVVVLAVIAFLLQSLLCS